MLGSTWAFGQPTPLNHLNAFMRHGLISEHQTISSLSLRDISCFAHFVE